MDSTESNRTNQMKPNRERQRGEKSMAKQIEENRVAPVESKRLKQMIAEAERGKKEKKAKEEPPSGYDAQEWKELEDEFLRDLENFQKYNKSFTELMQDILEGETANSFAEKTELAPNMLSRLKYRVDAKSPSQKSTIISVCVGYQLDLMMAQALFHSIGSGLNQFNRTDYAYSFLLTRCRGKDIEECNNILRKLGVETGYLLGAHARRPRSRRK